MKKIKTIGISVLIAACAACLSLAFVACKGGVVEEAATYGYGEEGFYYYDGADSARYMLSLQSGAYMITANGDTQSTGSYSYDAESDVITFTADGEKFTAAMGENALSLVMTDAGFSFKAYRYFDVTYVDESGNVIATESVLNGQSAPEISGEKDGYYFIGWYEDKNNSAEFDFATSIAGSTTVYGWYIAVNEGISDFEVTLDYGDGYTETSVTMNGAVWTLPASYNGSDILGWWVSATNKSGELTYRYETGTALFSDTTLFAVYSGIGASVTGSGITWENATGSNVTIAVYDEKGNQVLYATPSSTSGQYSYHFDSLSAGTYTVTVGTDTLTYVVNGLDRVSLSSVDVVVSGGGQVITFAPVAGAEGYEITVSDGTKIETIDLGSKTFYNFSGWEMTKEGLTFTVTAYAYGKVSSVSDEYLYRLVLGSVNPVMSGDYVVWTRVDGAVEYLVTVYDDEEDETVVSVYTSETSYSLKYLGAGTYTISVQPVTEGYWSEAGTIYGQSKTTIAAPEITDVTNYTISWTEVEGAASYVVMVNGEEYTVTGGNVTTLAFGTTVPTNASSYEIAVKALAETGKEDSSYSDTLVTSNGGFSSSAKYVENTVYWNYDVAATYYVISVNETEIEIDEGNSAKITLNKAGKNEITVTAYDATGSLGQATIEVYAYSVVLDPNGAELKSGGAVDGVVYVAQGDILNLGKVEKAYADFGGWYTQADYTEGQSDEYEGKGTEVADGSVFTGSRDMYLYAYWSYQYVTVYLDVGTQGTLTDENGENISEIKIKYNSTTFTVPTPEVEGVTYDFVGWYSGTSGGSQYTDETGAAETAWTYNHGETMYAQYVRARTYSKTSYGGETVYSVTGTSDAKYMTVMTVPEYVDDSGKTYPVILNSGAFTECTSLEIVNIPDSVRYISSTNDGYSSGSGAFAQCKYLKEVNLYSTGNVTEPTYFSEDGVLFHKMTNSEDVELFYYPYVKTTDSYVIPSYVCNEDETDWEGIPVTHAVTTLPTRIFRYRTFREVTIPSTITYIATRAFYSNSTLRIVNFEVGGTEPLEMEDEAFYSCSHVLSITLPARYTEFNAAALSGLTSLENIYVEDGSVYTTDNGILLDTLGSTILYVPVARGGDIDTDTITSTTITAVGDSAFAGNKKITSVTIGADVTYVGESAFDGCSAVTTITFNGDKDSSPLTIKSRAFYGCTLVKEVYLPENLTVLEANAFNNCSNLSYVYFDSYPGATSEDLSFAAKAFGSSNNIRTVEFGANVPEISNFGDVFDGGALREVIVDSNNENYYTDGGVLFNHAQTTILYYPRGIVGAYVVPDSVTEIGSSVFSGRANLTEITISKNVNTIGSNAFSDCTYLTAIHVDPENPNYGNIYTYDDTTGKITGDDGVLYERGEITDESQTVGDLVTIVYLPLATTIKDYVVPGTVTAITAYAFAYNDVIETIEFEYTGEAGSFHMGNYAFYHDSALTSVILPEGCDCISYCAFNTDEELIYVYMPSSITYIDYRAFYYCHTLSGDLSESYVEGEYGIKLNEGLEEIGRYGFYQCYYLAVTIPSTVTLVAERAFYQCWYNDDSEGEVVFAKWTGDTEEDDASSDVTDIDDDEENENEAETSAPALTIDTYAFCNTYRLTKIEIPARTTTLGTYAFQYAGYSDDVGETTLTFEEGVKITEIPNYCFQYMYNLKEINIPASVTTMGTYVFRNSYGLETVTFGSEDEPSKLTTIGNCDFYNTALKGISIPGTVTSIGTNAFYGCSELTSVTFEKIEVENENGETIETTSLTTINGSAFTGAAASTSSDGTYTAATTPKITSIEIPATVTSMGSSVFYNCETLTSVTFEDEISGLTSIGSSDFAGTSISSVTIPDCVTTISANAFDGCKLLSEVKFGENSKLSSIGDNAFANCDALKTFAFPESFADAITLGAGVFNGDSLTSLTLSTNILNVGSSLMGATIENITAENNPTYKTDTTTGSGCVLYSGTSVVFVCYTITTMTDDNNSVVTSDGDVTLIIPDGVTEIADGAFSAHTEIKKAIISKDVGYVGAYAFSGCTSLETVIIAEGSALTGDNALGTYAFNGCSALEYINLPEGITTIPKYCFYEAGPMSKTDFPKSITFIDQYAFSKSLIVNLYMEFEDTAQIAGYAFRNMEELLTVEFAGNLIGFTGQSAFRECYKLKTVKLPDTCIELYYYAFWDCYCLEEINLPEGMPDLGAYDFENCWALEEITIPSTVTIIDSQCFRYCYSLKSIEIPDGVWDIGQYCFADCTSLETVIWPQNLQLIECHAFEGCTKLQSVEFGPYMEEIEYNAFRLCESLTYVYIPANITAMGTYAFAECTSLEYAYTGDNITSLGYFTFYLCSSLETVEFGSSLITIGASCFWGCTSLKEVEIPASVTTINARAFRQCTSLTSIYISSAVTMNGIDIFSMCNCDIYIDNIPNYVAGWTEGWNGTFEEGEYDPNPAEDSGDEDYLSAKNTGTIYYFSSVEPDFNADGTGYAENWWHYDENENIVVWVFEYETYTVENDGGYVLYSEADEAVAYVCIVTGGESEVFAATDCTENMDGSYTVTLEDGTSCTVTLDESAKTATVETETENDPN